MRIGARNLQCALINYLSSREESMSMSRRDTIILAVLINASLLSILFFTATRPAIDTTPTLARPTEAVPVAIPQLNLNSPFAATRPEPQDRVESFGHSYPVAMTDRPQTLDLRSHFEPVPAQNQGDTDIGEHLSSTLQPEPSEQYAEVTVKRGDFLEKIARSNGVSVAEIKRINNLTTDRIDIGQVLLVPASKRGAGAPTTQITLAPPKQEPTADGAEYYTMKSGDNPWNIARQHRVKFDELLRLNNLDEDKARNLKPGDKIRVR